MPLVRSSLYSSRMSCQITGICTQLDMSSSSNKSNYVVRTWYYVEGVVVDVMAPHVQHLINTCLEFDFIFIEAAQVHGAGTWGRNNECRKGGVNTLLKSVVETEPRVVHPVEKHCATAKVINLDLQRTCTTQEVQCTPRTSALVLYHHQEGQKVW